MVAGYGEDDNAHQRKGMVIPREEGTGAGLEPVFEYAGSTAGLAADTECGIKSESPSHCTSFSMSTLVL